MVDDDDDDAPPSLTDSFEQLLAEPADTFAAPLTPGTIVGGRYEVIERIGAGAMGMVYLATDNDLQRKIALKLHKRRAGTAQLRREALAMARLAHPNVVTVFEVGEHDGRTFVAMEFVKGTTLRAWLAASGRTTHDKLEALLAAGEGLVAAHDAKLVHRDFKPENVLIGDDGRVRVSDFGLARESGLELGGVPQLMTQSTGVAGTPAYMAPEQALGISVDARADQYAFCACVWEALVGPWPRDDRATRNARIRRVLERGLQKDPSKRYPSMRALLGELRATRRRGHLIAGGIAVGLFAGAGIAAWAWPRAEATVFECAGAGIAYTTLGLDLPARMTARGLSPRAVEHAEQLLQELRTGYVAHAASICRAHHVDHQWSEELYRRGMDCLTMQFRISTKFISADESSLQRLVNLTTETSCTDATVLASQRQDPTDATREALIEARYELLTAVEDSSKQRTAVKEAAISRVLASPVANDPEIQARVEGLRGSIAADRGDLSKSLDHLDRAYYQARSGDVVDLSLKLLRTAVQIAQTAQDPRLATYVKTALADGARAESRAPSLVGDLYLYVCRVLDGGGNRELRRKTLAKARTLLVASNSYAHSQAWTLDGSLLIEEGKPREAIEAYRKADALLDASAVNDAERGTAKLAAAQAMFAVGEKQIGVEWALAAEKLLADPPYAPYDIAIIKLNLGAAYINGGDFARAEKLLEESRALLISTVSETHRDVALVDSNLASIYVVRGDYAKARTAVKRSIAALDTITKGEPDEERGDALAILIVAEARLGNLPASTAAVDACVQQYPDGDDRKLLCLIDGARVANDSDKPGLAAGFLARLRKLPPPEQPVMAQRLKLETVRTEIAQGRPPAEARATLDAIEKTFVDGDRRDLLPQVAAARSRLP